MSDVSHSALRVVKEGTNFRYGAYFSAASLVQLATDSADYHDYVYSIFVNITVVCTAPKSIVES